MSKLIATSQVTLMNLSDKVETRRETFYKLTNSEVAPEAPSVGGRNLLTGTRDWSSNIKRWSSDNNGVWHDEAEEYNGLKVKSTTDGWNGWHQNVFVKAGEYYTLSYYAKSDTNISVRNSLTWDGSPVFEGPVARFEGNNDIYNSITTEWKRHSRTVKITGDGSLQWRIEYNDGGLPSGKWYIAGMKLEERSSASDYSVAPEDLGWTMNILVPNQSNRYLWKFEYIYYSDGTIEVTDPINLSVAGQNGEDGKNSYIHTAYANITKVCNENESFTLTTETIMRFGFGDKWVYKTFGPGTYTANNTTFGRDPYSGKVKQCDLVTDFSLTDSTGRGWLGTYSDNNVNAVSNPSYYTWQLTKGDRGEDGIAGKDGVGLKSTLVTYGLSRSETDKPLTWYSQVPTLTKGDYLWTKTVWTYTDNTSETGYQKTYIARDGNNGHDGVPGKDGVGIKSTTITYASSTSGTTRPTSGWSSSIPNVPAGQYLWTKTVWTYTDNTSETGYSVSKMGEKGEDGKNSYMHFAYADDNRGTNFSLTDNNQRYQGYYSDYTEADSTDYRRYKWVDRLANVQVSTKNLILKSNDFSNPHKQSGDKTTVTSTNGYFVLKSTGYTAYAWGGMAWNMSISEVKAGEEFSILMPVYIDSSIELDSGFSINIKNHTLNVFAYDYSIPTDKKNQWFNVAITFKAYRDLVFDSYPFYVYLVKNGLVRIKPPMLVRGNVIPIDHTSAPEDIQDQIGDKADSALTQEQINALAEKNALIQAEMEAKASMDTVNQWITAYQNYVNANNADKKKSEQALQDASNRLLQVQYDVRDLKQQWDFIDTYMSVQNEGLIIGKKDGSAYAKFSNDRISLFSGNSEVMYISQGTLNIANGIFTKTLQIGRFRFETHPADVDMLVIRYLGG